MQEYKYCIDYILIRIWLTMNREHYMYVWIQFCYICISIFLCIYVRTYGWMVYIHACMRACVCTRAPHRVYGVCTGASETRRVVWVRGEAGTSEHRRLPWQLDVIIRKTLGLPVPSVGRANERASERTNERSAYISARGPGATRRNAGSLASL